MAALAGRGRKELAAVCATTHALNPILNLLLLPLPHNCVQSVARDIMVRLKDAAPDAGSGGAGSGPSLRVGPGQRKAAASSKSGCC